MSGEVIGFFTLGIAVVGVGLTLAGLILPGQYRMQNDVSELRERMAKLEGLFEGFIQQLPRTP